MPTIALPDFTALTAVQFAIILGAVALFDWLTGVAGAVASHTFDPSKLLDFLETHGLKRVLTIGAVFFVGQVAGQQAICFIADGLLALYVYETVLSSAQNLATPTPPAAA